MFLHLSLSHSVQRCTLWGAGMHAEETATEAGSKHPTGMHSCNSDGIVTV